MRSSGASDLDLYASNEPGLAAPVFRCTVLAMLGPSETGASDPGAVGPGLTVDGLRRAQALDVNILENRPGVSMPRDLSSMALNSSRGTRPMR